MKLYNKGARSFIIHKDDAIEGCRIPTDEIGKNKAYIDPGQEVEVKDSVGETLVTNYPKELMSMDSKIKDRVKIKKSKVVSKKKG